MDDGSGDASYEVLCQFTQADPRARIIKLSRNFGSNSAILAGMSYASGDCVGVIAADLQDPPETLEQMFACWENGHKVVFAIRDGRKGDPWPTRLFSGFFNWLFKKFVYPNFSPQGIGFFLIDRQVVDVVLRCEEKNAHLIGLILWTGFSPKTVVYDRIERPYGKSRWSFGRKIKYFIDAFTSFSYLPIRLTSLLGLILASMGIIYTLVILIARVFGEIQVSGWAALMVVLLVVSGMQLVMLGVIGEYLWRSLDNGRKRPVFIVDEVVQNTSRNEVS